MYLTPIMKGEFSPLANDPPVTDFKIFQPFLTVDARRISLPSVHFKVPSIQIPIKLSPNPNRKSHCHSFPPAKAPQAPLIPRKVRRPCSKLRIKKTMMERIKTKIALLYWPKSEPCQKDLQPKAGCWRSHREAEVQVSYRTKAYLKMVIGQEWISWAGLTRLGCPSRWVRGNRLWSCTNQAGKYATFPSLESIPFYPQSFAHSDTSASRTAAFLKYCKGKTRSFWRVDCFLQISDHWLSATKGCQRGATRISIGGCHPGLSLASWHCPAIGDPRATDSGWPLSERECTLTIFHQPVGFGKTMLYYECFQHSTNKIEPHGLSAAEEKGDKWMRN